MVVISSSSSSVGKARKGVRWTFSLILLLGFIVSTAFVFFNIQISSSATLHAQGLQDLINLHQSDASSDIEHGDVTVSLASRKSSMGDSSDRVTQNDFVPDIQIGQQYNAKACWLDPAWATENSVPPPTAAADRDNVDANKPDCVGRNPTITHTTAEQLSCPDNHPTLSTTTRRDTSKRKLTIALLYYASPAPLLHQLREMYRTYENAPSFEITLLIIDDGSPQQLSAETYIAREQRDDFPIRIAHITKDKKWNIGGARNLAFYLTETRRVLLNDLDILIPYTTLEQVMTWNTTAHADPSTAIAHRFSRKRMDGSISKHPAVSLLDASAYWQSGGCDEDFVGNYGFTDVHFWYRWKKRHEMIDHGKNALIHEFDMDACDANILGTELSQQCIDARAQLPKAVKDGKANHKKMKDKSGTGCWSNRYLRFPWRVVR